MAGKVRKAYMKSSSDVLAIPMYRYIWRSCVGFSRSKFDRCKCMCRLVSQRGTFLISKSSVDPRPREAIPGFSTSGGVLDIYIKKKKKKSWLIFEGIPSFAGKSAEDHIPIIRYFRYHLSSHLIALLTCHHRCRIIGYL
jgi:hypothetical protein